MINYISQKCKFITHEKSFIKMSKILFICLLTIILDKIFHEYNKKIIRYKISEYFSSHIEFNLQKFYFYLHLKKFFEEKIWRVKL